MKPLFTTLTLFLSLASFAQYRYDNVTFKTVYWDELCQSLQQNPGYLLLDVRSKGEHDDTSSSKSLNIGRLRGAMNIDIREIENRLEEIEAYKNKPVYVYCSHSQRSRRVSKLLADKGFSNVININGGVSNLRMFGYQEDCNLLTSFLPYQIISPKAFARQNSQEYFILDVRADSLFNARSAFERRNAFGLLRDAVNIPLATLEKNLGNLPKAGKILIVDEGGAESAAAAELLARNGFTDLSIIFNGLDGYTMEVAEKDRIAWKSNLPYHLINSEAFYQLAGATPLTIVDARTADEFNNKAKEGFRNIGMIKGAVNIPYTEGEKQLAALPADKEKPIVVYAFSSNNEAFETARKLSAAGYKNVNVLLGGLFNLRWRAANMKGQGHLADWVVNVPPDNR